MISNQVKIRSRWTFSSWHSNIALKIRLRCIPPTWLVLQHLTWKTAFGPNQLVTKQVPKTMGYHSGHLYVLELIALLNLFTDQQTEFLNYTAQYQHSTSTVPAQYQRSTSTVPAQYQRSKIVHKTQDNVGSTLYNYYYEGYFMMDKQAWASSSHW